jgi:hypothetical protein
MSEMVERVARAIIEMLNKIDGDPNATAWDNASQEMKEGMYPLARAAIEAMREPTDDMLIAGVGAGYDENRPFAERIKDRTEGSASSLVTAGNGAIYRAAYEAMIDAALSPSKTEAQS